VATHVVTGAYGFSGKYIASRLLERGDVVRTLTNSPNRSNPFGDRVEADPLAFDEPQRLTASLEGADVLHNTYWVRFNHRDFTHFVAVQNTLALFEAARRAGVRRVVHVSITNPSLDSDLEYFRGKAQLEQALRDSGLSYAILRPAVLFGEEDILVNNIAWLLRRFPVVGIFGDGQYRLQPIFVDDLAAVAVEQSELRDDTVIDAIGPETFTFAELVETIGRILNTRRKLISIPPSLGYVAASVIGLVVRDRFLTREEIDGLMRGLLCTDSPPSGETRLTEWTAANAERLGRSYSSELGRRRNREDSYREL
jgi:NADH dehydrogenase